MGRWSLIALLAVTGALSACDRSDFPGARDRFGPIPRFTWIEDGQPRPTPHIAHTKIARSARSIRDMEKAPAWRLKFHSAAAGTSDCYNRQDGIACLRRNWLDLLSRFGEQELVAPEGSHSYRLLLLPSFEPPVSIRLDIRRDGSGLLVTSWPDRSRTAPVEASEAALVEQAIAQGSFERMTPDPSALWRQEECYDGATWVFEAHANHRYRYVARHSCQSGEANIRVLAKLLTDLARRRTPDPRLQPHTRPLPGD